MSLNYLPEFIYFLFSFKIYHHSMVKYFAKNIIIKTEQVK